jgi:hypothetical protein
MADQPLLERKADASRQLIRHVVEADGSLLAAYWEWGQENNRWILFLVPKSKADERGLVQTTSDILVKEPYRSIFSLSDVVVDGAQIKRARAIGAYIRSPQDIGRQFDTTFTGGHYFEGVVVMYVAPELAAAHHAA